MRYVHTNQTIGGRVSFTDPRNVYPDPDGTGPLVAPPACPGNADNGFATDGSCYPNIVNFVYTETNYDNWLPSVSAALDFGGDFVARASWSKTMTRPNPNVMLPGLNFSSPSADVGTVGNPELDPFISTNIDLGMELYTGGEGLIAVAAFRKSITGFTVNGNVTVPFSALAAYGVTYDTLTPTQQGAIDSRGGPAAAEVVLTQQVNADGKLTVNGLEFQIVQPLDFLTEARRIHRPGHPGQPDDHRPEGRRRRRPGRGARGRPHHLCRRRLLRELRLLGAADLDLQRGLTGFDRQPERHPRRGDLRRSRTTSSTSPARSTSPRSPATNTCRR